jgi:very-short-patch-repair endonuclease
MGNQSDTVDAGVAKIAARQHGIVTMRQLEAVGLSKRAAAGRVQCGRLHRIHRGVYAVGHRPPHLNSRFMAAVLACGPGAVLSHVSAAVLWKLLEPIDGPVHVSVATTSGRKRRSGIHLHRCPSLSPPHQRQAGGRGRRLSTTHRDSIPVTTVARTIEDLGASSLSPHLIRRARRQAELKGYRLDGVESDRTRSDLETAFLALFAFHRIPRPEVNPKLGRYEVDFLWRAQKLVVEADTFLYHRGSVAFESDYERDLDLREHGYAVLRFTDKQLETEPERIAADVHKELNGVRR